MLNRTSVSFRGGVEGPYADRSSMQMYRVTIRATQDTVPKVMLKMMQEQLSRGISTELS